MSKNEYNNLVRRYMDGYDVEESTNTQDTCGRLPRSWMVRDVEFKTANHKRRSLRSAARINKAKALDRFWENRD